MLGSLPLPTPDPSDEDLLAAHLAGERGAFEVLWGRHRGALLGYGTRMLGDHAEAEEVVHEAFLRAASGRWRPDGRLRAWLFTVVHRQCLDRLRRRRKLTSVIARLWTSAAADGPEEAVLRDEAETALERALSALPEEHRAVVLLYYGQQLASKEVAAIVGCEDLQVRSRLSYARRLLRRALGEEEP
jgi:RNA polymerase sigma-70 factor (ECF subfamily)